MYYTSSSGELRKVRQICFLHALVHVRNLEWEEYCHGARKTGPMYRCLQHGVSPESQSQLLHYFRIIFFHVPLISLSMLPSRKHTDQISHAFVLGHVKHGNGKVYVVNLHMTITYFSNVGQSYLIYTFISHLSDVLKQILDIFYS